MLMSFAEPLWLLAGIVTTVLLVLGGRLVQRHRHQALTRFVGSRLLAQLTSSVSRRKRRVKNLLLLLAVFLLFTALARPQYGYNWVELKSRGIDILFAIDTSRSMLAADLKPNRLARARLAVHDFVIKLSGDRVGLLPFAGSAYLMVPLTADYEAFTQTLASLEPGIIPQGGTNLAAVIDEAVSLLSKGANHKILVLITDGEDLAGKAVAAAEKAALAGLTIHTVGVGTGEGELIPVSADRGSGFVKDEEGNYVTSRLDRQTLETIAEKTGGIAVDLGVQGEGLELVYQEKLAQIPKEELAERRHKVPIERFQWPLCLALVLLLAELLVGDRRRSDGLPGGGRTLYLTLIFCLAAWLPAERAQAADPGHQAYANEDYLAAAEYYRQALEDDPENLVLHYNLGTAAHKNNLFAEAAEAFAKTQAAADVELQKKGYYNRAVSLFRQGEEQLAAGPSGVKPLWEEALGSAKAVLALDPNYPGADQLQSYIEKRLAALAEPPKEQNNQQNQQEQQENASPEEKQQAQSESKQQQDGGSGQKQQAPTQPQGGDDQDGDAAAGQQDRADSAPDERRNPEQQAAEQLPRSDKSNGQMSREEAAALLDSLQEEGELNFIPAGPRQEPTRDW